MKNIFEVKHLRSFIGVRAFDFDAINFKSMIFSSRLKFLLLRQVIRQTKSIVTYFTNFVVSQNIFSEIVKNEKMILFDNSRTGVI